MFLYNDIFQLHLNKSRKSWVCEDCGRIFWAYLSLNLSVCYLFWRVLILNDFGEMIFESQI